MKRHFHFLLAICPIFWACEEEPAVEAVVVSPGSATIKRGDTQQFTATVIDDRGDTLTGTTVEWSSSSELVATISGMGLATGMNEGTATITATADGVSGTASLVVELSPQEVIPGNWTTLSSERNLSLTANSNQTASDIFAEGDGTISITGALTADLTYMFGTSQADSGTVLVISSSPLFGSLEGRPPLPALVIFDVPFFVSVMAFSAMNTSGDTARYATSPPNYSFDESSGSLTIPAAVLYDEDKTDSVTATGTLTYAHFTLSANTPTTVNFPFFHSRVERTTMTFSEDGQFTRATTFTGEGDTQTETAEGNWLFLTDSTLTVIETILEGQPLHEPDTLTIHFILQSEVLMDIWFDEDPCEEGNVDFGSGEVCLRKFEKLFRLDEGSLVSVLVRRSFVLQKDRERVL